MSKPKLTFNASKAKEELTLGLSSLFQKRSSFVAKTEDTKSLLRFGSMKNITTKTDKGFSPSINTYTELNQKNCSTKPKSEISYNYNDSNTFGYKFINDIHKIQETTNGLIDELKANNFRHSLQINSQGRFKDKQKSLSAYQLNILKLAPIKVKDKEQSNTLTSNKEGQVAECDNHKTEDKDNKTLTKDQNQNKKVSIEEEEEEEVRERRVNTFHRKRILHLSHAEIFKRAQKVFFIPIKLVQAKGCIEGFDLQVSVISDQLKLIFSSIQKLKTEFLFTSNFMKAFSNLKHEEKSRYNLLLEETLSVMISVVPKILKKIFNSLDQIIYCKFPNAPEEEKKAVISEDECLIVNIKWYNEVTTYFSACIDIFDVIKTKKSILSFTNSEYFTVKVYLDTIRFNSNTLIAQAKAHIDKCFNDEKLISNFEVGCELKPKQSIACNYDIFDRIFQGERPSIKTNSNAKLRQINAVLDNHRRFKTSSERKTPKEPYYLNYYNSLLNKPLINVLMKYYNKETREKIIANRVIERYRHNELNMLFLNK